MSTQNPPRTTVQLDEETKTILDDLTDDETGDYASGSAAVREALRRFDEIEAVRARRDDLRRQLAAQNRRSGEVEEVVEYAREEKALRSDRDAREQRRRSVSILTRTWWRLTGEPPLETNGDESAANA